MMPPVTKVMSSGIGTPKPQAINTANTAAYPYWRKKFSNSAAISPALFRGFGQIKTRGLDTAPSRPSENMFQPSESRRIIPHPAAFQTA